MPDVAEMFPYRFRPVPGRMTTKYSSKDERRPILLQREFLLPPHIEHTDRLLNLLTQLNNTLIDDNVFGLSLCLCEILNKLLHIFDILFLFLAVIF